MKLWSTLLPIHIRSMTASIRHGAAEPGGCGHVQAMKICLAASLSITM